MADANLRTSDVLTFNNVDMDAMLSEVLDSAPFLAALPAKTATSDLFKYTNKTANPSVGFRATNAGIEGTRGTYEQIVVTLKYLDASFWVDVAVADTDQRGADHAILVEAVGHLRQAMREVEEQILRGTNNIGAGFDGFEDLANLNALADTMVIDGGGSGSDVSSVYLLHAGEQGVEIVWGRGGEFTVGPRQIVDRPDGTNQQSFKAYSHMIGGYCGLKRGHDLSVCRIANLEDASSNSLTDDLIAQAMALFPVDQKPNMIVAGRAQQHRLQQSRTATNPTGAPAPFPATAFNTEIITVESLAQNETAIT
tara:strand:- start:3709 stop:4638 length:930 start_codon:yes stop_codon:yes gene_type:complete